MKKHIFLSLTILATIALASCASNNATDDNLSYPNIQECTSKTLLSGTSYICLKPHGKYDMIETSIHFGTNSFTPDKQARKTLDKLYAYLKLSDSGGFVIQGYAGRIDSKLIKDQKILTDYNIRLSKNRAMSVKDYLHNKGLDIDNVTIEALGYQNPITPNDSSKSRAVNQRVEISIASKLSQQIKAIESTIKIVSPNKYKTFFSNVLLINQRNEDQDAEIYKTDNERPSLIPHATFFVNKKYAINDTNESSDFLITSDPEYIESFNEDMFMYKYGTAQFVNNYKDITIMKVTNLIQEAAIGDYVIPSYTVDRPLPDSTFKLKTKITANILKDIINTSTLSSSYNTLLINRGETDGLKIGTEMLIYAPTTTVDGYPVPPKYLGYGFVYRMSDHYSLVLVVNSLQELTKDSMVTTFI
jgi:outer membrane protein OmpA-like peptidoglycan-associated protein